VLWLILKLTVQHDLTIEILYQITGHVESSSNAGGHFQQLEVSTKFNFIFLLIVDSVDPSALLEDSTCPQ
jgi:hypothetical protein